MKIKSLKKKNARAKQLSAQAQELAALFFDTAPILAGTLSEVKRKCGNPNCHCAAQGQGHAVWTLLTKHNGKRRCQVVRKADVETVGAKVQRYQQLRDALRQLKDIDAKRHSLFKEVIAARNECYK